MGNTKYARAGDVRGGDGGERCLCTWVDRKVIQYPTIQYPKLDIGDADTVVLHCFSLIFS